MPGAESRCCNGSWAPWKRAALLSIPECWRQKVRHRELWKPSSLFLSRPKYPGSQLTLTCVYFMVEKQDYLYSKKEKYHITQCCNWQGELAVLLIRCFFRNLWNSAQTLVRNEIWSPRKVLWISAKLHIHSLKIKPGKTENSTVNPELGTQNALKSLGLLPCIPTDFRQGFEWEVWDLFSVWHRWGYKGEEWLCARNTAAGSKGKTWLQKKNSTGHFANLILYQKSSFTTM